jgi:hypothetical protein
MAHIGMNEKGMVEIIDGHNVIRMSPREAKRFFKELEKMIKWIEKTERKK